jgi:hypothetical protein
MARATARLTSAGNAVFSGCNHPQLLAAWEAAIAAATRSFDHRRGRLWVSGEFADTALGLAERFLDIQLIAGPRWRSTFCPCQGALHRVRRLRGAA